MRRIEKILLILGVLSVVVLALPELGVIALISVIGIPLALVYWAIPAVFLTLLTAYLIHRVLRFSGNAGAIVSLVLALVALAIPPFILNGPIHRKAALLAAGDQNKLELPITPRSIASREKFRFSKGATQCDGFCLHALLTGTAERFLVAKSDTPVGNLALKGNVIEFRLERGDTCPSVSFKSGMHVLKFPFVKGDTTRAADPVETLKLRASEGECLVSEPATLGDAEIVISRGNLTKGVYRHAKTGFSFTTDTVTANRIAVHQKKNGNQFDETYRQTQVRYRPFGWLLVPSVTMRGAFNVRLGWWRNEARINVKGRYEDPYQWTEFLSKKLGFDLKLKGEDTKNKTLEHLRHLLDEGTPPSMADWALFSQYFDRMGIGRNARMSAEDFELGLRLLESENFPAPPRLYNLVNYAKRHAGDAELARLADQLVRRLSNDVSRYQSLRAKPEQQIKRLASGVRGLPDAALLPHKDTMMSLATRPDIQFNGYNALARLAVYGEDAVPTLLALMKAGFENGTNFFRDSQFQHPYLSGLKGLCFAGANATSALPELRQLTAAGRLPDHASYGRLLFTTLLRLGEDRDKVRALFMAATRNKANATDKHFDWLAARAMKANPPCHY